MIKRLLAAGLILAALAPATTAVASQKPPFIKCKFMGSGNDLKWEDRTRSVQYANAAVSAVEAWNSASTQFNMAKVSSGANIRVADGNFGPDVGFAGILLNADGTDGLCGADQRWHQTQVAWWNTALTDRITTDKRKAIMVHEIGHALGLAHTRDSSCDYSIMDERLYYKYGECAGISTPRPLDVAAVNDLY